MSIATLCAAPFVLFVIWISAAVDSRPTAGGTYIDYEVMTVGDAGYAADLQIDPDMDAVAIGGRTLELTVWDGRIERAHYLWVDLMYVLAVLVLLLAVTVAVGVLRRRPASRLTAGVLVGIAVFSAVSAWVGPTAREWASITAAERAGLPWGMSEAQAAGSDAFVVGAAGLGWWWISMVAIVVVSAGAAMWVLHVRRQLRHAAPRHPELDSSIGVAAPE